MKFALVLAAVIALGTALPAPQTYNLKDDFNDFMALLPTEEMLAIGLDYLANDAEVQSAMEFITSEDFKNFILEVESIKEYQNFIKYLNDAGLDVYAALKRLHELLELPEYIPPSRNQVRRGTGIRGLVDDIEAILPKDKIQALYYEKLETSPEFKNLIDIMSSDEFKKLVSDVRANPQYQALIKRAKEHGLDVEYIAELVNKIFGWGIETKFFAAQTFNLKDDFYDFVALLPKEEILAIALDYLANDAEVQNAVEFVMSEDFKNFILEVEGIQEYKNFIKYLQGTGLDVYAYLQKLHDLLGLPEFVPPTRSHLRKGTGIRGLVDDIEAILPIEKIRALYREKLESSPDFKQLIDTMSSEEFKKLVSDVRANPQYQELIKRAKEHGLDVEYIAQLVNKIFGWGIETLRK